MAKSKSDSDKVIIKKYANRRLYDTSTSSYVTLDYLSELVRKEVAFEVRDAKSGEDLTRQVLTQIIFEKENKGEGALPVNFLRQLIGFYGGGSASLLPAWLEMSMNSFAESQDKWTKAVGGVASPFSMFEKQARANLEIFENAMRMFSPGKKSAKPGGTTTSENGPQSMPGFDDDAVAALRKQMKAMQAQIDALSGN